MSSIRFKVLSYNIHKGFSSGNLKFTLRQIKQSIQQIQPDLVCLQEILGYHEHHKKHFPQHPHFSQPEYLAEGLWPHLTYGKNAVYPKGHHGNAILSRYSIQFWENQDISLNSLERRGMLHSILKIPKLATPLHIICIHLGLFETDRNYQINTLCDRIRATIPNNEPLLVAGDFNDWRKVASAALLNEVGLTEAFLEFQGSHAKTFPVWLPALSLDRIYYRGLKLENAICLKDAPWSKLSDHAPLFCEFLISKNKTI